jgi:ectoine hydroxylase-related dioxygenase (phytanoyl-CoA dioxygenase family)
VSVCVCERQDNGIYVHEIPAGEPEDIRQGFSVYSTREMEMAQNVTVRLALDPQTEAGSGPLWVLPRTHMRNYTIVDGEEAGNAWIQQDEMFGTARPGQELGVMCPQMAGDCLFYSPLTMHRSEEMRLPDRRRRTLFLQYAPASIALPGCSVYRWPLPLTPAGAVLGKGGRACAAL